MKSRQRRSKDLSPDSPLAAMSLWESRTMILSSLDLWTSMLFTADVSAATTANPFPTRPNTHSIFAFFFCPDLRLRFPLGFWRVFFFLFLWSVWAPRKENREKSISATWGTSFGAVWFTGVLHSTTGWDVKLEHRPRCCRSFVLLVMVFCRLW